MPNHPSRWPLLLPLVAAVTMLVAVAARCGPDLVRLQDLLVPVGVSGAAVLGSLGLARLLTPDPAKTGLLALLMVVIFAVLGDAVEALHDAGVLHAIGGEASVFALFALMLPGPILLVRRTPHSPLSLCRSVAGVLGALIALNTFRLIQDHGAPPPAPVDPRVPLTPRTARPPDIYLIVVDRYAASWALLASHGYDNAPFEVWLRSRGFLVPDSARANYVHTFLSLASLLNFRYLDDYPARFGRGTNAASHLAYPDIENARLVALLRSQGYRFVFVPSAYRATRRNRYADLQFPDPAEVRPEYAAVWHRSTALPVLHRLTCRVLGCDAVRFPYVPETAEVLDRKFAALADVPPSNRPTFVLAHLMVPHDPMSHRADCSHRPPYWPMLRREDTWEMGRQAYVEQIQCVNRKLQALIEGIGRRAARPPVILVQSDHGHGLFGLAVPHLEHVSAEQVADRLAVFAAYQLPGVPPDSVVPGITPVNVIRLVLRHYLGANLPPLPDVSYWSSARRPYDFRRVAPAGP